MIKYHGNTTIVDGIIAEKTANGEYEKNPDCKDQTLYNCWDSTAVIKNDGTVEAQEVVRSGAVNNEIASATLSDAKYSICVSCPTPKDISQQFE